VLVILDEAYIEFQTNEDPDASLDLLRRFGNLVILRTFSKVYGLAGLRVGFALGSEEFKAAVDRVRQPFSVNHLAQTAATEALRHQDDVARRVEWNVVERLWMEEELRELGVEVADSQANFCWVSLGDHHEPDVVAALSRAGVAVRPGMGLGGPGHMRVTYGMRAENERFIAALRGALEQSA
jgi:histidinol-phosphate aminotransferase